MTMTIIEAFKFIAILEIILLSVWGLGCLILLAIALFNVATDDSYDAD